MRRKRHRMGLIKRIKQFFGFYDYPIIFTHKSELEKKDFFEIILDKTTLGTFEIKETYKIDSEEMLSCSFSEICPKGALRLFHFRIRRHMLLLEDVKRLIMEEERNHEIKENGNEERPSKNGEED